jgi:hypothetical protein
MPAIANSTQAPKRATFARKLTRLSLGLSVAAWVHSSPISALGQTCDQCASQHARMLDPSCGCEPSLPSDRSKKNCTVPCVPKPSFAEKFLKRLDELGDSIETRSMQSSRPTRRCNSNPVGSNCECTPVATPSCGCESHSIAPTSTRWQDSGSKPNASYPFPDNPNKHAIGSLGDQHLIPPTIETPLIPSEDSPQAPSNALPGRDKSSLPDVLVDPFKDDVSASRPLRKHGVSLTSDMQSKTPPALVRGKTPRNQDAVVSRSDAPAKLTADQRAVPSIQFDAVEPVPPTSNEEPIVVPSSFWDPRPVVISPRRNVKSTDQENAPHVPRMQVPLKR